MSEEYASHNFLHYSAEPLVKRAPRLDPDGLDLVSKFLLYEARKRISAKDAMRHPYFDSLGPGVHNLLDGEDLDNLFIHRDFKKTKIILLLVQSVFSVPGIHLSKDPGYRSSTFQQSSGKSRRQSMLL